MSNRVRQWYLAACKNGHDKPTVKGLLEYWKEFRFILDDKLRDRIFSVYPFAKLNTLIDYDKYIHTIFMPY